MVKKIINLVLLVVAPLFIACNNEDDEEEISMTSFGYVVGNVDGVEYNLVNTRWDRPVSLPVHGGDENLEVLMWGQKLAVPTDTVSCYLHLILRSVHTGQYLLKHSAEEAEFSSQTLSGFCLHREGSHGEAATEYIPLNNEPFTLLVRRLFWLDPSAYASLECEMNGVLCNKMNPNDTIVVSNLRIGLH